MFWWPSSLAYASLSLFSSSWAAPCSSSSAFFSASKASSCCWNTFEHLRNLSTKHNILLNWNLPRKITLGRGRAGSLNSNLGNYHRINVLEWEVAYLLLKSRTWANCKSLMSTETSKHLIHTWKGLTLLCKSSYSLRQVSISFFKLEVTSSLTIFLKSKEQSFITFLVSSQHFFPIKLVCNHDMQFKFEKVTLIFLLQVHFSDLQFAPQIFPAV